jgi:hypothetical protein
MTMSNLTPLTFAGDHGPFAPSGPLAPYRWVAPARPRRRFAYGAALDTEGREAPRVPAPAVSAPP